MVLRIKNPKEEQMLNKLILSLSTILCAVAASASTKYAIDAAHSAVTFKVTHLMISTVPGRFDKFDGEFTFDEKTGKVDGLTAKIDVDSINTNDAKRDAHLRNDDFFGTRDAKNKLVETKRWMNFAATKVETKKNKPVKITGDLTLNGVTKPVTLTVSHKGPAKDPWGNQKLGFEATGKINRKDFGIVYNKVLEAGGVLIGEDVEIAIQGQATAAAAATTATTTK